jgi:hypothetical protein
MREVVGIEAIGALPPEAFYLSLEQARLDASTIPIVESARSRLRPVDWRQVSGMIKDA